MARRARERRNSIPGYDEHRPSREDRKREHRKVRHAAKNMLHSIEDPEALAPLPEVKRTRDHDPMPVTEPTKRRFRVWKTKFWKRRDQYQDLKSSLDARWDEVNAPSEEDDW